ncbi:MAG: hypothetical protein HYZ14_06830 [Bacteroidetes bacterium]|nr:hypothetical protein [Bacteroidota bacterium]
MVTPDLFNVQLSSYLSKTLSPEWLDIVYREKWFKLFLPQRLGGLELSLPDGLEQIRLASSIHGSLGWCVNLGSGAAYFYRFFNTETATKLFSDPRAVIAGSGLANGKAIRKENGYLVSGSWDKCSGSGYATAFTGNAVFEDGKVHSLLFFKDQVNVSDNWSMFAMKATSSFRFETENVFIPEEQIFDIGLLKTEDDYAVSEIPFDIFARFCMIASLIGTVECFASHLEREFQTRIRPFEKDVQNLKSKLESDKSSVTQLADRYWSLAKNKSGFTEHHLLNLKAGITSMSRSLYDMTCDLFYKTGIELADENTLTHHAFRDVLMASQHGMMK